MNLLSWILTALIAAWFIACVLWIIRRKGNTCNCARCSGNCAACQSCAHCRGKKRLKKSRPA